MRLFFFHTFLSRADYYDTLLSQSVVTVFFISFLLFREPESELETLDSALAVNQQETTFCCCFNCRSRYVSIAFIFMMMIISALKCVHFWCVCFDHFFVGFYLLCLLFLSFIQIINRDRSVFVCCEGTFEIVNLCICTKLPRPSVCCCRCCLFLL